MGLNLAETAGKRQRQYLAVFSRSLLASEEIIVPGSDLPVGGAEREVRRIISRHLREQRARKRYTRFRGTIWHSLLSRFDAMLIEIQTQARSMVRRLGLVPLLDRFRSVWRLGYEDAFSRSLLAEIRPGDCVWDIGANVGYYSQRIASLASRVVAFEPVPETFSRLSQLSLPNATFVNTALGDVSGVLPMSSANDASSLAVVEGNIVEVQVARGDDLDLPQPNVVKIDVEGFEYEVISGMQTKLRAPECRAAFCELHFEVLEKRGLRQAPAMIVKQLKSLGFTKIRWLDASHISAHKP
jgi:FkbM family methyltransferase